MEDRRKLMLIIGGAAGHGKDSLANYLKEIFEQWSSVRTDAYAYTLKKITQEALCVPWDVLTATKDIKESTFVDSWNDENITVRKSLQDIGEWFRSRFGSLIWANSVRQRSRFASERVVIVTDARHPKEEIHWMREACSEFARVFVIRIRRDSVPIIRGHPSEDLIADEPDSSFDFIIENDNDLDWLKKAALELACACVFLQKTRRKKINRKGDGWEIAGNFSCEPLVTKGEALPLGEPLQITYPRLKGRACAGQE